MKDCSLLCVRSDVYFTKGKTYYVCDNIIRGNHNTPYNVSEFSTIRQLNWCWEAQFELALKEEINTTDDLKVGMAVKLRNGDKAMVSIFARGLVLDFGDNLSTLLLEKYNKNLEFTDGTYYDIVEVYGYSLFQHKTYLVGFEERPILWKREKPIVKVTMEEVCAKFGYEVVIKKSEV